MVLTVYDLGMLHSCLEKMLNKVEVEQALASEGVETGGDGRSSCVYRSECSRL